MTRSALFPRPWSNDKPKVPGYAPLIRGTVEKVGRSKRNAWRCVVEVDGLSMATSHHDTRAAAESHLAGMIEAYAEVHYIQV